MPHDWDAASYDRLPIPMTGWGLGVLDRLPLRGGERVLDAGCGTGQVTEALRERLPDGEIVALDASPSMLELARARLGEDRVSFLAHDLLEPIPIAPVDAILSTATFHWVPDHDRLFANLAAILRPDGRMAAQSGGAGNLRCVNDAVARATGIDLTETKVYPTPAAETDRLQRAGFTDVECWLHDEPVELPPDELEAYLRTVILSGEVARRTPSEAANFVHAVAIELGAPVIDYVRLDIAARRSP